MIQKIDDCKCDFKNENQSTSTQRVKEAFLRQVSMGVDARKAFLNSLNAIDEKYNPKNDEYICEDAQMVGKICIGTKLITFCIPALMVFRVFKEKNYGLISLNNTIICCGACAAWCLFGKCTNDMNAMCANGIAVLLCLAQICVYFSFKSKYSYSGPTSTIGIDTTSSEETKKDENSSINIDEENQEKIKDKPVRIVTKIDN